jgi:hypothetical protein
MNDRDFEMLNDYLDGALTLEERRECERMLESDAELRAELEALKGLQQAAATLPAAIAPPRELWDGIEERLVARRKGNVIRFGRKPLPRRSPLVGLAAAAALAGVLGLSVWNAQWQTTGTPEQRAAIEAPAAPHSPAVEAWRQAQNDADLAYEHARAELLDALAQRRESLSPELKAILRDNMAVIENAVHEINVALADDPENPSLRHILAATREKELTLLEQIVSVPDAL